MAHRSLRDLPRRPHWRHAKGFIGLCPMNCLGCEEKKQKKKMIMRLCLILNFLFVGGSVTFGDLTPLDNGFDRIIICSGIFTGLRPVHDASQIIMLVSILLSGFYSGIWLRHIPSNSTTGLWPVCGCHQNVYNSFLGDFSEH